MRSSTKNPGGSYEQSGLSKEDEIIPEILFIQFLIRLASPVEKRVDIAFVGVIGLRTESPQFDFRRQLLQISSLVM